MASEQQVRDDFSKLFKGEITEDTFAQGWKILEQLRAENPLRHRLSRELEEIRKIQRKKCSRSKG
jgi:hypothetical protein